MIINTLSPILKVNNIEINIQMIQTANCNVLHSREVQFIVLHYTGNKKDTAKANANYFLTSGRGASAHYFVDETSIYQSVALKNTAWHCGTKKTYYHSSCRNANSIGIEMCCSGDYKVSSITQENTVYLVVELCKLLNITSDNVDNYILRHYDITHKSCPAQWSDDEKEFKEFKNKVKNILNPPVSVPDDSHSATTVPTTTVVTTPPPTTTTTTTVTTKTPIVFKVGDAVKFVSNAKYYNGKPIHDLFMNMTLYIRKLDNNNVSLSPTKTGYGIIKTNTKYLIKINDNPFVKSYKVKVVVDSLNIRKGAGTNYNAIGKITDKGTYTIIGEKKGQGASLWLELKSGGYISADFVKKV